MMLSYMRQGWMDAQDLLLFFCRAYHLYGVCFLWRVYVIGEAVVDTFPAHGCRGRQNKKMIAFWVP